MEQRSARGHSGREEGRRGKIAIKTQPGNTVKKNADPDNPAGLIEHFGNDVVKRAPKLTVEQKVLGTRRERGKPGGEAQGGE
ncbi:hypothetical protein DL764_003766 [Monosporascus ibericus]|uniref:Uncharacterized protein n=1 Tax=Monosporascus ibericus TaxID=155417 RepID=A0A4Q4TFA2_9PEZI|nr:hypothetical protein DL764_003766 [Monosporascus ibericus]